MDAAPTLTAHQDLLVATLGSGSRGNATYVGTPERGVLVDCGLSTLQIRRRLEAVGLDLACVAAVLVTHEHSDHCAAGRILSDRLLRDTGQEVPFYMTPGTALGLNPKVRPRRVEPLAAGSAFAVAGLTVEPHTVPHDVRDPVGFVLDSGRTRVAIVTDLGRPTRLVAQQLASADVAVLEFNHDLERLWDGPYPWALKRRVASAHGHLSNLDAGSLLAEAASAGRLQKVLLAHLSEENNSPELAVRAAEEALHRVGRAGVHLEVAPQDEPVRLAPPSPPRQPALPLGGYSVR